MTAHPLALRFPKAAADALRRELDTVPSEKAVEKAKDDEVRQLIGNGRYEDARRLILHYYGDTLIAAVVAALSDRYAPRGYREAGRTLRLGEEYDRKRYLDEYFAVDKPLLIAAQGREEEARSQDEHVSSDVRRIVDVFQKCLQGSERVVVSIAADIRKRIKKVTDEYDPFDFALGVHCLRGRQYDAFLGEQAEEKVDRYSVMEARRTLAMLRKACKEAPEKYPHVTRYTAVRWLCYCFSTGMEKNADMAAHRIRDLNSILEGLPAATRIAALRVMNGHPHEAAAAVARQAPMLADCGAFYRLLATLPNDLCGIARMLMGGKRHADIAARFGVSKDEVAAYRNAIERLLAAARPGTERGERDDD